MAKPKSFPKQTQRRPGKQSEMSPEPEIISNNYLGSKKLTGKIALITGGDSGIGRSIAVHFAREGADIGIIYLSEKKDAETTKELVEKEKQKCILIEGDLKSESFCKSAVTKIVKELGGINVLVNNAALHWNSPTMEKITKKQLQETFETNVYPFFYVTREALKHLEKGDSIINTTSVTAYRGSEHLLDYSSTKGAIVSFTRSLSAMLAKKGIRVNGLQPRPWTPLVISSFDDTTDFGQDTPMGRAGQPSEVAPAFVFLASEDSSYITGQIIHVNGGEIVGG